MKTKGKRGTADGGSGAPAAMDRRRQPEIENEDILINGPVGQAIGN